MEQKSDKQHFTLSVFLPFYNEEENIRSAVGQTIATLENMPEVKAYEVIVVDDGSKDKTGDIARTLSNENQHVRLVSHPQNRGYGEALRSGIHAARYEYVFFTDGDLQFDIREIKKLTHYIPHYQVVIGYRAVRRDPFMRLLNARGWNMLNRIGFGLKIRDIDCAFKLFKRELVADIPMVSTGAMFSAELLIRLKRAGVEIKEVPVTHLPRRRGSPTGAKLSVIGRAFREWWNLYSKTDLGNKWYLQAYRFIGVGVLNTLVDVAVYYCLTRYTGFFAMHITTTRILSFLSGSICSFVMNRIWTFERKGRVAFMELIKFYATVLASLLIGLASMQILMAVFHLYDLLALLFSIALTFVWNFSISKMWVFKKNSQESYEDSYVNI